MPFYTLTVYYSEYYSNLVLWQQKHPYMKGLLNLNIIYTNINNQPHPSKMTDQIEKTVNRDWVNHKLVLTTIKKWVDGRIHEELEFFWKMYAEYSKAVIDTDSTRQLTILVNVMVEYCQKAIPPEWESIDDVKPLSTLVTNPDPNNVAEMLSVIVIQTAEQTMIDGDTDDFAKQLDDMIMENVGTNVPYLLNDIVVVPLVAKYICAYVKVVVTNLALMMNSGAKRIRHDVFNNALRSTILNTPIKWKRHYNNALISLYQSLPVTKPLIKPKPVKP